MRTQDISYNQEYFLLRGRRLHKNSQPTMSYKQYIICQPNWNKLFTSDNLLQNIDISASRRLKKRMTRIKIHTTMKLKKLPFVKLVFKLPSPNRLSSSAIPQRISSLYHKTFDDTMKNKIVIIAISAVCSKILHSFWTFFRIQSQLNVTHCGMKNLARNHMNQKK